MPTEATLCFILRGEDVLLLLKAEGRFGGGKWNGPGGKMKAGETPIDCVKREVREESGLDIPSPRAHGTLYFRFGDDPSKDWLVHVYSAREFSGDVRASDEGDLRWFSLQDIPYDEMWEDDRHWLPYLLRGESFRGDFLFDPPGERLLSYGIQVVKA